MTYNHPGCAVCAETEALTCSEIMLVSDQQGNQGGSDADPIAALTCDIRGLCVKCRSAPALSGPTQSKLHADDRAPESEGQPERLLWIATR